MAACELHEMDNCAVCTGAEKKYRESLAEPGIEPRLIPYIPGGPTIQARFDGTCSGCGARWARGDLIHHPNDEEGWIGVECCVRMP